MNEKDMHRPGNGTLDERINIRGYFEQILKERDSREVERDKRLDERFESQEKAVSAALAAAEKAVTAAFVASEKAVTAALSASEKAVEKAETAQLRVNATQNEFRGTLKDQAAELMPRAETALLVAGLQSQINALGGTRREGVGLSIDVIAKLAMFLIATIALIVSVYLGTNGGGVG